VASRLQPAGRRDASPTLPGGGTSLPFMHLTLAANATPPARLSHEVKAQIAAAPPGDMVLTMPDQAPTARESSPRPMIFH
jgi:hypothetical protein